MSSHLEEVRKAWIAFDSLRNSNGIILNGENDSLTLAHVVAVAR